MAGLMFGKGHTISGLTGEQLDVVVQRLSQRADMFDWGISGNGYTSFVITAQRELRYLDPEIEFYASYSIYFSKRVWKKLRLNLSNEETELVLRGEL